MLIHKCGQCGQTFKIESDYLKHKCSISGFTPKEIDNLSVVYQSEPPKIASKAKMVKLTETEILKAVTEARKNKKT